MTHARQTLRAAAKAAISAAVPVGTVVKTSRAYAAQDATLPAVIIYTPAGATERHSMGGKMHHQIDLTVEIYVYALPDDVDDEIDALCVVIEPALVGLAGTLDARLEAFQSDYSGEGAKPVGFARLTFALEYIASETDPETILT